MTMKMRKIPGVDKSICTCEQKIAYNYAFNWREQIVKIFNSEAPEFVKAEAKHELCTFVLESLKRNGTNKRYNIDAIIHCFRVGMEDYAKGVSILSTYKEIGEMFKCLYPIG